MDNTLIDFSNERMRCVNCSRPKSQLFGWILDTTDCPNGKTLTSVWDRRRTIEDDKSDEAKEIYAETLEWAQTHGCHHFQDSDSQEPTND